MDGQAVPREHQLNGAALNFYLACKSLIDRGFYVLPCRKDKRPATAHGFKDATQDLHQVYTWAQGISDAQPAVACAKSGLVVIDIDDTDAFDAFLRSRGLHVPDTLSVLTPSGGKHLYFAVSRVIHCASKLCEGVDIKHLGYVLAPPATAYSKRADCHGSYQWVDPDQDIAPMPDWPEILNPAAAAHPPPSASAEPQKSLRSNDTSLAELAELLFHVPADIDYNDWLRMLGAVYTATSGSSQGLALAAGKTFVALNIANHVARNLEWNGQRVRGGPVVYFAAEGGRSLGNRLVALPGGASANLHLVPEPIDLYSDELDVHAIVQLAKDILGDSESPALIVIDTLARSIGGADENTGTDVGLLINRVDFIRRATGANVMLVHHTGKDIERGARGHSSLRAAVDTEIFCGKKDGQRYIEATKQRNVETGAQFPFQLEPHFLGLDTDGDEKNTCYVKFLEPSARTAAKKGAGGNQRKVLDLFQQYRDICIADGTAKAPDEAAPSSVDREGFRTFAVPNMGKGDDKKNRRAFDDALRALTGDGALVPDGESLALQY